MKCTFMTLQLFLFTFLLINQSINCLNKDEKEDLGYVIGIDLGTTYSCVGVFQRGRVEIFQNEQGNRITPSYVAFTADGTRLIGDPAKNQLTSNAENTVYDAKRLIGRKYDDPEVTRDRKVWPFNVVKSGDKPLIEVKVGGKTKRFTPDEISSMVLIKMKQIAETNLEANVTHAVITVPAYFNDAQRQSTKDAGTIAGLNVMRIINEPTAAAIAYGFDKKEGEKNILVFDLGGGTFDVSLLVIDNGVFEVIATNGDTHLGGEDFDNKIVEHLIKEIKTNHKIDVSKKKNIVQRLRREAEKAKRTLSKRHQATIEIDNLTDDETVNFVTTLTRAKFEELNMKEFQRINEPLKRVLADSKLKKSEIDEIILVGGSTRIPKIQDMVKKFFNGKELNLGINPDEAVAYGAAIQAGILSGANETADLVLVDVASLSKGIETSGGIMTVLIPRNTRIPAKKTQIFTTVQDFQESVDINVYEGERPMVKDNHKLDFFRLTNITKARKNIPQIEVTFEINQEGILQIHALEKSSGVTKNITINNDEKKLSAEEIEKMIKDAEIYAEQDKMAKDKVKTKLDIEQLARSVQDAIALKDQFEQHDISDEDIQKCGDAASEALKFVESNPDASPEDLKEKLTELTDAVKDIAPKLEELAKKVRDSTDGAAAGDQQEQQQPPADDDAHDEL